MLAYLLLGVSILCCASNNLTLRFLSKKGARYNPFLFNVFVSLIWIVILMAVNLGIRGYSANTLIYGLIYGAALTVLLLSKTIAMSTGPVGTATLIGSSSFVITTIFNSLYFREEIGPFEISGIILMAVAIFLMVFQKNNGSGKARISVVYVISCLFILISGAAVGTIFRFHQSVDAANSSEMLMTAAATSAVLCALTWLFTRKKKSITASRNERTKKEWIILGAALIVVGIVSCAYCRLNISLVAELPSSIFFPVFNGTVIAAATILGFFLFKEKLTKTAIVGCILGLVSILLVSHFFGVF